MRGRRALGRGGTRRSPLLAFTGVAIVASALSLSTFHHQLHALTVGGLDLGFFMAEYERLLDVAPWRGLAVQPNGNDAFGFGGMDGFPTLHHDVHLSPLKYALALVHLATGSWLAVQLTLVASLLAALAYVLVRWERERPGNTLTLPALAALAISPPFVRASAHDLRPIVALGAVVVVFAAALLSRAPSRHLWVFAGLGLFVREDAAVLLALACAWLHLDGRRTDARKLYVLVLAYVLLFHALYFGLLPFAYAPRLRTVAVWVALLAYPALRLAPEHARAALSRAHQGHRCSTILVLALPFAFVWLAPIFGGHLMRNPIARSFPGMLVASVAGTYWLLVSGRERQRRWATGLGMMAIVPMLALSLRMVSDLRAIADRRAGVWAFAESLPRRTPVLTDFAHYQAFAGRDRLLVWERLPAARAPEDARELPASRQALARELSRFDGLVIVSDASFEILMEALRSAGVEPSFELCRRSPAFLVARASSSETECPAAPDDDDPTDGHA